MYIGIDLGGTGIKAGLVNEDGRILYKTSCPTRAAEGCSAIAEDMGKLVDTILKETNTNKADVKSIGIGVPGAVDNNKGEVIYTANINMKNAPLVAELKKHCDFPVFLGNDANCAALGEYFALNNPDITNLIAVTLGTGVGGGIILDGKIFTGSNAIAGEIGHMIIDIDGEKCGCGAKGCWEAYASATALIRDTKRAAKKNPDSILAKIIKEDGEVGGITPFKAKEMGDETGTKVVENYIKYIAIGIINIINIFQPQSIVIGGGVSKQGDNLVVPLKKYVEKYAYGADFANIAEISTAKLGNDAGLVGAAFLGK